MHTHSHTSLTQVRVHVFVMLACGGSYSQLQAVCGGNQTHQSITANHRACFSQLDAQRKHKDSKFGVVGHAIDKHWTHYGHKTQRWPLSEVSSYKPHCPFSLWKSKHSQKQRNPFTGFTTHSVTQFGVRGDSPTLHSCWSGVHMSPWYVTNSPCALQRGPSYYGSAREATCVTKQLYLLYW